MKVLAIDPGNIESAYCVVDGRTFRPIEFGKADNRDMLDKLWSEIVPCDFYVIERVASYGMPVGREVFDTCEWIGRFTQIIYQMTGAMPDYIFRIDEREAICHDSKAGDANIRRALIDEFADHDLKNGKGTKKNPDFFYGFAKDVWAAYAVAYTYLKTKKKEMEVQNETA